MTDNINGADMPTLTVFKLDREEAKDVLLSWMEKDNT
jgi:hypothetical protein